MQKNYLIGTFCIVNFYRDLKQVPNLIFNRNILYCKSRIYMINARNLCNLIGTFCIVNFVDRYVDGEEMPFNRNILYCK